MEPDSGYLQYRKDFSIPGTPTVLFLDADGKEIDRFVGYGGEEDRDEIFQKLKDYAAGINTLPVLLTDLEKKPSDVDVNFKLAEKYQDRSEKDKAMFYFEKVLELDPNDERDHKVESTYQVAFFQARTKQNVEPMKAFITTNPDEEYLLNAYSTLASIYSRRKDTINTVATYEEALQKLPDNAQLMNSYAGAIFRGKIEDLYDKGLELNEKAKILNPDLEISTIRTLVSYYRNFENKEKVSEIFENGIEQHPDNDGLKDIYAETIFNMAIESKYDRGIEIMENAIAKNPDLVHKNFFLGLLYQRNGELEKAIAAVKKVVEKYPTQMLYADQLARMEKRLKESK